MSSRDTQAMLRGRGGRLALYGGLGTVWLLLVVWALAGSVRPRVSVPDAPASGPMIVEGPAHSAVPKVSPTGRSAAAWMTAVLVQTGAMPWVAAVCQADVDTLEVGSAEGYLAVSPEFFASNRVVPAASIPAEGPDVRWPASEAPVVVVDGCKQVLEPVKATYVYYDLYFQEFRYPEGRPLALSGCRRGDILEPCGDVLDGVGDSDAFPEWEVRYASGFLRSRCTGVIDLGLGGCFRRTWHVLPISRRRFDATDLVLALVVLLVPPLVLAGVHIARRRPVRASTDL